jgi:hypothetical protein
MHVIATFSDDDAKEVEQSNITNHEKGPSSDKPRQPQLLALCSFVAIPFLYLFTAPFRLTGLLHCIACY